MEVFASNAASYALEKEDDGTPRSFISLGPVSVLVLLLQLLLPHVTRLVVVDVRKDQIEHVAVP